MLYQTDPDTTTRTPAAYAAVDPAAALDTLAKEAGYANFAAMRAAEPEEASELTVLALASADKATVVAYLCENWWLPDDDGEGGGEYITREQILQGEHGDLTLHADGVWSFGDTQHEVLLALVGGQLQELRRQQPSPGAQPPAPGPSAG